MLDNTQLEEALRDTILDVCEVLYQHGYKQACVGAIMRLIGVPPENAQMHDDEIFALDEKFLEHLAERKIMSEIQKPPGERLH
jgi:hypothetical protein